MSKQTYLYTKRSKKYYLRRINSYFYLGNILIVFGVLSLLGCFLWLYFLIVSLGCFHVSYLCDKLFDKWFNEYVLMALVHKRHVPKAILKLLKTKPIIIPEEDNLGKLFR